MHSFRQVIEDHSWLFLWIAVALALINIVIGFRETWLKIRSPKEPHDRRNGILTFAFEIAIFLVAFLGALSSQWSSETLTTTVEALRKKTGNRTITQRSQLLSCLKTWSGGPMPLRVWHNRMSGAEPGAFADQILSVLNESRTAFPDAEETFSPAFAPFDGVVIFVKNPSNPPVFANFIKTCFEANGISPISICDHAAIVKTNSVTIFISTKP